MPQRTQVKLHFEERGEGTPVLAVHGWEPDHRLMLGCLEPIFTQRSGYRRLYPDLPSMGNSPAPAAKMNSSDDVLAALEDFIDDHIGTEPFLLLGESYGGYLARAIAHTRREQVLGLALICPSAQRVETAESRPAERRVLRPDPDLIASLDEHTAEIFTSIAVVESPEVLRRFCEEILPGLEIADYTAMERIRQQWQLTHEPEDDDPVTCPTLILTGRQDDSVGYLDQFELLGHYPRATYVALDSAGHNLQIEQPAVFEALVSEWIDRITV
ncbi:alpha/beta fold hydrolase [Oceanobacillus locisalsi]|uniref:Alpha/beta fold hydrolase n=1 Tax=Oceanobacillus locisalsi TaxID=546107 RepID=A0ABW3NJR6_9BACI